MLPDDQSTALGAAAPSGIGELLVSCRSFDEYRAMFALSRPGRRPRAARLSGRRRGLHRGGSSGTFPRAGVRPDLRVGPRGAADAGHRRPAPRRALRVHASRRVHVDVLYRPRRLPRTARGGAGGVRARLRDPPGPLHGGAHCRSCRSRTRRSISSCPRTCCSRSPDRLRSGLPCCGDHRDDARGRAPGADLPGVRDGLGPRLDLCPLRDELSARGISADLVGVDYQFQLGEPAMLVCRARR